MNVVLVFLEEMINDESVRAADITFARSHNTHGGPFHKIDLSESRAYYMNSSKAGSEIAGQIP
jgi:hypothetical protein